MVSNLYKSNLHPTYPRLSLFSEKKYVSEAALTHILQIQEQAWLISLRESQSHTSSHTVGQKVRLAKRLKTMLDSHTEKDELSQETYNQI